MLCYVLGKLSNTIVASILIYKRLTKFNEIYFKSTQIILEHNFKIALGYKRVLVESKLHYMQER